MHQPPPGEGFSGASANCGPCRPVREIAVREFLTKLLSSDFMGHGYCYLWRPEIVWLHVTSDTVIMLSYYMIPLALFYFVRKRRDLPFHWMFLMFGVSSLAAVPRTS